MTLNTSGPISLGGPVIGQSIQYELYETTSNLITLNDSKVRQLAQVPFGAIVMPQDFWGKTYTQFFTITTDQVNFDMLTYLIANGWDPLARAEVTIAPGVYIYSNSTGTPALSLSGLFKKGVKLTNNGFILGMGGRGGNGGGTGAAGPGLSGGIALSVSVNATVDNTNGTIGGGGGGGGGGGSSTLVTCPCTGATTTYGGGGGGGGQTGLTNSLGGTATNGGGAGVQGTLLSAGTGGAGNTPPNGRPGATGGAWGSSGGTGANAGTAGGVGGAGGAAIVGNTNITWQGFGLRFGAIS